MRKGPCTEPQQLRWTFKIDQPAILGGVGVLYSITISIESEVILVCLVKDLMNQTTNIVHRI